MVAQCRSCLTIDAPNYISMDSIMIGEKTYVECFNDCTRLDVSADDVELPLTMCTECSYDLQMSYKFLQASRHSDGILKSIQAPQVSEIINEDDVIRDDSSYDIEETVKLEVINVNEFVLDEDENTTMEIEHLDEDIKYVDEIEQQNVDLNHSLEDIDTWSEDEVDDMYLTEYKDENVAPTDPQNSDKEHKWKCTECYRLLQGDVSKEGHMNWHKGIKPYKCTQCIRAFRCKEALYQHATQRHRNQQYSKSLNCPICKQNYHSKDQLAEHQLLKHQVIICRNCLKRFDTSDILEEHLLLAHSSPTERIQCTHCDIEPIFQQELSDHFRSTHPEEYRKHFLITVGPSYEPEVTSWQCDICQRWIYSKEILKKHLKAHQRSYECKICAKRITTSYSLRCHMRRKHSQEYKCDENDPEGSMVPCKVCKKNYLKKNLRRHMTIMHNKEKNVETQSLRFLCTYCQCECGDKETLDQHISIHGGETVDIVYVCSDCDRPYNTQKLLEEHRKQAHRERGTICPVCGNAYKHRNQLVSHMKLHKEKKIQCPHCEKKYAQQSDLNVHLRTHTGEMPFACHLCDKRFAIKVRLTYHLQKHQGVRYPCSYCPVVCETRPRLKEHTYKHTGMPYMCEFCPNVGFTRRFRFANHMLRAHNWKMTDDELAENFTKNTGKVIRFKPVLTDSD